jgi:NAD(P)-dependent dehydrogenase (short-subunit alcohol dehydrogenase family)
VGFVEEWRMMLEGKTCLVTGGSSGLGLATAKRLSRSGACVVLLSESQPQGELALQEILRSAPAASVDLMICDLASLGSVRNLVRRVAEEYGVLDLLVNSASVLTHRRSRTEDGFPVMFQVNYLAPLVLALEFMEQLERSVAPHIINLSVPPPALRLDLDDLASERGRGTLRSFRNAKLCLLFASLELARRWRHTEIVVTISDPTAIGSELVRDALWPRAWFGRLFSARVERAAENILYVATSDEACTTSGCIYVERHRRAPTPYWNDPEIAARLWCATEGLLEGVGEAWA